MLTCLQLGAMYICIYILERKKKAIWKLLHTDIFLCLSFFVVLFFVFISFFYFYGYAYLVSYVHKVTKLEHPRYFLARFVVPTSGHALHAYFCIFFVSHFFAFFKSYFVMGLMRSGSLSAHATQASCVIALASSVCEITRRENLGCKEEQAVVLHLRLSSATSVQGSALVKVSLQLSDDLVHFFILKPFQRKCCWPSSEDDPATL